MTDDEKRELIAEAEEFVKYGADLNSMEAERLIGELCDALEGTLTEPEWEYAVRDRKGRVMYTATAGAVPGDERIRRRKAGEWEVVADDRD